jgi:ABC-type uncharacterized transport system ATPase subunit
MNNPAIKVDNLRKNFGELQAVQGISFEVHAGEIFGSVQTEQIGHTYALDTFPCGNLVLRLLKSENTHGSYARNRADLGHRTKPDR